MPDLRQAGTLWQRLRAAPRVADGDAAHWRLLDLLKGADAELTARFDKPRVRALLAGIADHSPYLWGLIAADPARALGILDDEPHARLDAILTILRATPADEDEPSVMRRIRRAKQEVALLVAVADIGGVWPLEEVIQALSRAADAMIAEGLGHLLAKAVAGGKLRHPDASRPEDACGLVVLGLGKLGGLELNYSSDVDLIVIFDPDSPTIVKPDEAKALFVRITQGLVRLLNQATADGYALRVDLRLRPDPSSTAVAIGIGAAFLYYEAYGQNWERAAMIKARVVAGDQALGRRFIEGLSPFIWRKYFDYAAIADIHAMKRQIHAVKGHAEIAVGGHNVKLGRGGIREIEFFVQTQQLIFGGKRPDLRGRRTLSMLRQLRRDGWIGAHAVADLTRAYDFLRRVEHRLQMLADEQTHRLPSREDALERFARFCGFASAERFAIVLTRHLRRVVHHYALLFETAPGLDDPGGSLVFTGVADDPETIETLKTLGFKEPARIAQRVREWHSGKRLAVRSARARETLTELVPRLLVTFARTFDPDGAVAAFDAALDGMPAGGELFAILAANAALRTLFGDILGSAPRLAAAVALRPHLLDATINPASAVLLDEDAVTDRLMLALARAQTTEEFLDMIRELRREEHFLIGVRLLSGELDPEEAGRAYSALAVGIIRVSLDALLVGFAIEHGRISGGCVAVVAMGKLGSCEMTATSDLDLLLLYDFDAAAPQSSRLHATQYFTRLAQRLVSHLTVATRRGGLYQVDMRLRPSGNQGPLATKISAFSTYQSEDAATWEHMALTRARVIAGDVAFGARVTTEIMSVLRRPSSATLGADVAAMRALIEREKKPRSDWDFKLLPGGLIDIEFIAQYLLLGHASTMPDILDPSTQAVLSKASGLGLLPRDLADCLLAAHRLFTNTTQIMRLALDDELSPDQAGEGMKHRLALAAGVPDFARLREELAAARQAVREIFAALIPRD